MNENERCFNVAEILLTNYPPLLEAFHHVYRVSQPTTFQNALSWKIPLPRIESIEEDSSFLYFIFRILSNHIYAEVIHVYSNPYNMKKVVSDYIPILGG